MKNLEIDLLLTTKTHLTIGSGEREFLQPADISQVKRTKEGKKIVCIPATTLKGILRMSAIQIAHFILGPNEDYCKTVDVKELDGKCIICNIFGANNKQSKLYVEDAYSTSESISLHYFTQTHIDRSTGRSKEGSLFTKEEIPPNIMFETKLVAKNLELKEEKLLLFSLKNMNFCSFGNRGGLMKIEIKDIKNFSENDESIKKIVDGMKYYAKS